MLSIESGWSVSYPSWRWSVTRAPRKRRTALTSPPTMGSGSSKANRPAPLETTTLVIPRAPQEIIDEIASLRSCFLVAKSWVPSCRRHLFHTVTFASRDVDRWLEVFPVPEESPAHHLRDLRIWIGGHHRRVPERLFECTPWFTNVEKVSLLGYWGFPQLRIPSCWRLPQSVTSLTVNTNVATLVQIRNIMAQLPNLENLSLSGSHIPVNRRALLGRFVGQLQLCGGYADEDTMNMLLEIPNGLHFSEARIQCMRERLLSAVGLVEACGNTLVKLSHTVTFRGKSCHFSWSGWSHCVKY